MRRRGAVEKLQNGRSRSNGKIRDGAHQEALEYPGDPEGGLSRVGKGAESTIGHAECQCPQAVDVQWAWSRQGLNL